MLILITAGRPAHCQSNIEGKVCRNTGRQIVTYLDILGFKDIVETKSATEINQILELLRRVSKQEERIAKMYKLQSVNFSDLILRIADVRSGADVFNSVVGLLFWELNSLLHIQAELAYRGIFIRGAVSIGDLYSRSGITFGPAFVREYELETTQAVYPRIVVDPKVFQAFGETDLLKNPHHTHSEGMQYIHKCISRADDGWFYIDYLKGIEGECEGGDEYFGFLARHKITVERELTGATSPKIYAKYVWLAERHNTLLDGFTNDQLAYSGFNRNQLVIEVSAQTKAGSS